MYLEQGIMLFHAVKVRCLRCSIYLPVAMLLKDINILYFKENHITSEPVANFPIETKQENEILY